MSDFAAAIRAEAEAAWALMEAIGDATREGPGITRAAFGEGEQQAAAAVIAWAEARGLAPVADPYGNLHVRWPGQDSSLPSVGAGSHLDSVPQGGNYDGLAGTVAALAALAAAKASGTRPRRGLHAIAMRGEESPWFATAYLGARLMLGRSTLAEIGGLRRFDSGRTLREHMAALDIPGAPGAVLGPQDLACFFELHIEQGPLLEGAGLPLGIATGIRGNLRFPEARILGEYGHASAVPRAYRRDAVTALAELVLEFDRFWESRIAAGDDNFVFTIGKVATDPAQHAMTKVPGEIRFSFNCGGTDAAVIAAARDLLFGTVAAIEARRGVRFELGPEVGTPPVALDPGLMAKLEASAARLRHGTRRIPTVGHDTAMYCLSGIPSAMLLVRNQHGSHNPQEAMEKADFIAGAETLAYAMLGAAT
ncbi:hydantoinase/carbamoylase family amidase [Siccirubricoccus phaeus]|uniref:hydantoinase/carbamoylase family amidase n=1 Tax=Siccirubricoccus phaeus TaxID=2595053 RepID=UPI0011F2CEB7|nr:hydantoinase/carbamoylase family amidase [Siccirubricoccus phaeus]